MTTAFLFAASVVLLVVAAELFTNAVEWAGYHMRLARGATGSLLAAMGTSLPEFVVPLVALIARGPSADSVAMGAVLGAPFLLLTVGSLVTAIAVLSRRGARELRLDPRQPRRDLGVFLFAYPLALIAIVLPFAGRVAVGCFLLLVYVAYVLATLRGGIPEEEMPEPLHLVRWREGQPHPLAIALQLVVAVAMLVLGSQLFVTALNQAADALRIPALVLALIVVPLATELPETMNSVLWVRSRDDPLAFGNIAGSATFQSCVLVFIGVIFTSWRPTTGAIIGAILTLLTAAFLLVLLRNGRGSGLWLMCAGVPWVGYVVAQAASGGRLGA
jgi:cation:H+ antiporter